MDCKKDEIFDLHKCLCSRNKYLRKVIYFIIIRLIISMNSVFIKLYCIKNHVYLTEMLIYQYLILILIHA